jgi:hypothetical protein
MAALEKEERMGQNVSAADVDLCVVGRVRGILELAVALVDGRVTASDVLQNNVEHCVKCLNKCVRFPPAGTLLRKSIQASLDDEVRLCRSIVACANNMDVCACAHCDAARDALKEVMRNQAKVAQRLSTIWGSADVWQAIWNKQLFALKAHCSNLAARAPAKVLEGSEHACYRTAFELSNFLRTRLVRVP